MVAPTGAVQNDHLGLDLVAQAQAHHQPGRSVFHTGLAGRQSETPRKAHDNKGGDFNVLYLNCARQAACMSESRMKPHWPAPPPVDARHCACRSLLRMNPHWPEPPPVIARQ